MNVTRTVTVHRPAHEVYAFWREVENLPRFMYHLECVTRRDATRSHWIARGPAGRKVEWDAEIVDDQPGEQISWRTTGIGDDISHSGTVSFTEVPGDHSTIVRVELVYDPPGGRLGATIARLFGEEPGQQIADDLRRLKEVLEQGEFTPVGGSPIEGNAGRAH